MCILEKKYLIVVKVFDKKRRKTVRQKISQIDMDLLQSEYVQAIGWQKTTTSTMNIRICKLFLLKIKTLFLLLMFSNQQFDKC